MFNAHPATNGSTQKQTVAYLPQAVICVLSDSLWTAKVMRLGDEVIGPHHYVERMTAFFEGLGVSIPDEWIAEWKETEQHKINVNVRQMFKQNGLEETE